MTSSPRAEVAVIGGSRFYSFLEDPTRVSVDTIAALPADEPDDIASCPCRRSLDRSRLPLSLPS